MGVVIELDIDDADLRQWLDLVAGRIKNFTPLLKRFQVQMIRSFSLNFIHEGRPTKWRKLSPNTIAGRRKMSDRVLQDTGRLRMSALATTAEGNITTFTSNSLRMGSSLSYASYHQFGTTPYTIRPRRKKVLTFMTADKGMVFAKVVHHPGLTARPFIVIQDEDIEVMIELASDYVTGGERFG